MSMPIAFNLAFQADSPRSSNPFSSSDLKEEVSGVNILVCV